MSRIEKLQKFISHLDEMTGDDGLHETASKDLMLGKTSKVMPFAPEFNKPSVLLVGSGKKRCFAGERLFSYGSGDFLITLLPMPLIGEIADASPEAPFMAAGITLDTARLAKIVHRIDQREGPCCGETDFSPSGIISAPASESLLDTMNRLIETLSSPRDFAVLGDALYDELYYRILCDTTAGNLRSLIKNRERVQRISSSVQFIHENINKQISVDELAKHVYMSRTTFYNTFKEVMHVSPLQYTKTVKLSRANMLLSEGKRTSEAGFLVGYNSPAQFSREYKRYFGVNPSETRQVVQAT